jgi:two-component system, response regulator RegA
MMSIQSMPTPPTPALKTSTILVVDDDERFRLRLAQAFEHRGYNVLSAQSPADALALCAGRQIDRATVDLRMPGQSGLVLVQELIRLYPEIHVVVLTGYGSIATAVEAMRLGALDYLTKPCHADRILAAFDADPDSREPKLDIPIPSLALVERDHIERVLHECNGNVSKAARALGMHRRTLQYKLAKFPVSR